MDKQTLAQQLRERQYACGYIPRHFVDAISDEEIIDSYITCSCCGEKQVSPEQQGTAIEQARDTNHFLEICNEQARATL
jgi:hypothetical protein